MARLLKKGAPKKGYEGKEHVKFKEPLKFRHKIRTPEEEPHMKSRLGKNEENEAEDTFHKKTPMKAPKLSLPKHIPRPYMKMEDDNRANKLTGDLVTTNDKPVKDGDSDGWEDMGPNEYQMDSAPSKEKRKKVITAMLKKKMKKK